MNILFLNGSPKGKGSITIKTALYLQKRFPTHNYEVVNIGQQIKSLEKDFSKVKQALEKAELIVFCYPVYTFIAPFQVHRFIELITESNTDLSGKFAAQISTSKHFYDITALKFIEENCLDMGMLYLQGLSADMDDLRTEKGRFEADCFFEKLMFQIDKGIFIEKERKENQPKQVVYNTTLQNVPKNTGKDVVIVTNVSNRDENLKNMIADFKNACVYNVREVNIRSLNLKGGCIGCMNCAITGNCIYKDGFEDVLRTEIQNADAIITAFTIKNHYTDSSMKCYDDRQFCNGHRTVTTGKATGYIISGVYSEEANLRMIVESRSNVGGMYYCGVAGDEKDTAKEIQNLANTLAFALENKLSEPQNFYGIGGSKIFRDLVYLMQGLMQEDHKFYKSHGYYDFPQKKKGMLWSMRVVGLCMKIPSFKKKMGGKMSEYIEAPYDKVIENTRPKGDSKWLY